METQCTPGSHLLMITQCTPGSHLLMITQCTAGSRFLMITQCTPGSRLLMITQCTPGSRLLMVTHVLQAFNNIWFSQHNVLLIMKLAKLMAQSTFHNNINSQKHNVLFSGLAEEINVLLYLHTM